MVYETLGVHPHKFTRFPGDTDFIKKVFLYEDLWEMYEGCTCMLSARALYQVFCNTVYSIQWNISK